MMCSLPSSYGTAKNENANTLHRRHDGYGIQQQESILHVRARE